MRGDARFFLREKMELPPEIMAFSGVDIFFFGDFVGREASGRSE